MNAEENKCVSFRNQRLSAAAKVFGSCHAAQDDTLRAGNVSRENCYRTPTVKEGTCYPRPISDKIKSLSASLKLLPGEKL
jgi:hypothetical protein